MHKTIHFQYGSHFKFRKFVAKFTNFVNKCPRFDYCPLLKDSMFVSAACLSYFVYDFTQIPDVLTDYSRYFVVPSIFNCCYASYQLVCDFLNGSVLSFFFNITVNNKYCAQGMRKSCSKLILFFKAFVLFFSCYKYIFKT